MQLTEADKLVISKVRRQQRLWLRLRGFVVAGYAALCLAEIAAVKDPDQSSSLKVVAIVAVWAPLALGVCFSCAIGLGVVIGHWSTPLIGALCRWATRPLYE